MIGYSQNVSIDRNNDKKYDSVSTSLTGGRYEFLMSDLVVRQSFKVDKYTGDIYQLVEDNNGRLTWELLIREVSANDLQKENSINYQLYMSGIAVRFCFLINVNTGIAWQLVKSKDDILHFEIVE